MAIMLGVANILAKEQELRDKINLKFLFQPAEEGGAGAERMIKESALKNPTPDILLAGHVSSQMEVGHFGFVKGIAHAAADTIQITVNGSGGHAARPEKSIDPVVAAASLIMQLQTIITRNIDALSPAVLTIGSIQGGTKSNIIPEVVVLRGTIRTHDKTTRDIFLKRIKEMCKGIDQIFGTTSHFEIGDAYPACFNHVELTEFMYETALELFGNKKVHWINPSMGGEDFAYFTQKVPGTMIRLGCLNTKKGITYPCHNPQFDVDERVLDHSVVLFSEAAKRWAATN
jgi:amidohydrolase